MSGVSHKAFDNGFFYSASQFYRERFGCKVYKLSIDAGTTCPNRDGTKAFGGCIFCSERGSGDFAQNGMLPVKEQISRAKTLVSSKMTGASKGGGKNGKYLAYFQNFSNTYGEASVLRQKYLEALSCPEVAGLSVATRPDCLSDEIIAVLKEASEKAFLQLELGLQTSNEKTGEKIRRFYSNEDYKNAVTCIKTKIPECHVVTHLIYGLPGEEKSDMLGSLDFAVKSGTDGIKIACLHVLKNTALYTDFMEGRLRPLEMEEYFELLGESLVRLPDNVVVHRLTGDGDKKILVSPLWTADKKRVLNSMNQYFKKNGIFQGRDAGGLERL